MPFVFAFVGVVFIIAGARGTSDDLVTLVKGDVSSGFIYWILAIAALGALGYIDALRPFSRALMVLVLVVLVLTEGKQDAGGGGFFQKFTQAVTDISRSTKAA